MLGGNIGKTRVQGLVNLCVALIVHMRDLLVCGIGV